MPVVRERASIATAGAYRAVDVDAVAARRASGPDGLSQAEAVARLEQLGPNRRLPLVDGPEGGVWEGDR